MMKPLLQKIKNKEYNPFDTFILVVIILSGIIIGLETDKDIMNSFGYWFHDLDIIIVSIFIIEIIIKMIAEGKKPWRYFNDGWHIFDFVIVILSFLPYFITQTHEDTHALVALRVFRLARIFRVVRVFRVFRLITHLKPLELLVETLIRSIPSMSMVALLLSILFYVYGIIGVFLFRPFDEAHFGSVGISIITLFTVLSGNWIDFMESIMAKGDIEKFVAPIYFISFYFLAGLIVLNLFVGIIVDQLSTVKIRREAEELREGYQDDLTAGQNLVMADLEKKADEMNELIKNLKIVLNRNNE